jgi:aspartate carbamoyltransferase catalytic subunit
LRNRRILIVGDILHSRVAHSNIKLLTRLGGEITLLAPPMFRQSTSLGQAQAISSYDETEGAYDAVMCLRIQKERIDKEEIMRDEDFFTAYGLTTKRLLQLGKNCVVLHPGPANIGVEIEKEVLMGPKSLVMQQVRNGVFLRAALMDLVLGR